MSKMFGKDKGQLIRRRPVTRSTPRSERKEHIAAQMKKGIKETISYKNKNLKKPMRKSNVLPRIVRSKIQNLTKTPKISAKMKTHKIGIDYQTP